MKLPDFSYHRPATVAEAVALLAQHRDSVKVLAGGQSLVPMLALRLAQPSHLVDIGAVAGLDEITATPDGVEIGAALTQRDVERSRTVATECPVLVEAVRHIGHSQTRARGTICGSLVHADPAAELPALALALDASFTVQGPSGCRRIAAENFFHGFLSTDLADDELVTAVSFPHRRGRRGASLVEISRRRGDFALVGAVCAVALDESDRLEDVRISLFGVASTPVRVREVESRLLGSSAHEVDRERTLDVGNLQPMSDLHATGRYRLHVARHVVGEVVRTAIERAQRDDT